MQREDAASAGMSVTEAHDGWNAVKTRGRLAQSHTKI
jgi:hypothetical protein